MCCYYGCHCFGQWPDVCIDIDIVNKLQNATDSTKLKHMNSSVQALVQSQNRLGVMIRLGLGLGFGGSPAPVCPYRSALGYNDSNTFLATVFRISCIFFCRYKTRFSSRHWMNVQCTPTTLTLSLPCTPDISGGGNK